jgi:hypothetical protein
MERFPASSKERGKLLALMQTDLDQNLYELGSIPAFSCFYLCQYRTRHLHVRTIEWNKMARAMLPPDDDDN